MSRENEIKAMFDAEFSEADIFVTEDLIARTMLAIGDVKKENGQEKTTEPTENTRKSASKRRTFIKWASGIAAALLVGVIGIGVIRGMSLTKSEDSPARIKNSETVSNNIVYNEAKSSDDVCYEKSYAPADECVQADEAEVNPALPQACAETVEAGEAGGRKFDSDLYEVYDALTDESESEALCSQMNSVQSDDSDCASEGYSNSYEPNIGELTKEDFDRKLNTVLSLCISDDGTDAKEAGASDSSSEVPEQNGAATEFTRRYFCGQDSLYEELTLYESYMTYTKNNADGTGEIQCYRYSVPFETVLEMITMGIK